jgi:alkylhydroperoxidase family enzyme
MMSRFGRLVRLHDMNPIRAFAESQLNAFERTWNYDVSYMRALLARGFGALRPVLGLQRISAYRKGIPLAPWSAAKIVAARAEDCGPCVQLVVTMAERAGVAPATLRAVLAHDDAAMPEDARLAVRFTDAVLSHAPEADELREQIVARWGEDAVISLAYAILSGRAYPTLKYALGYAKSCVRVKVAGEETAVPALAPGAFAHVH